MRTRRLVPLALAALALLATPAGAAALGAPPVDPAAQELAEKYVPITMLREQLNPPCNTKEEQYQPTSVDAVLGNPTVTLTHEEPDGKLVEVKKAPTAADIAGLRDGWYLDYEGKVLGDTCVYARAFKKLLAEGKAPAITYAHIAREPNHDGFTLQFWFFWYFNQFNDLHEGDWEGMQLSFESNTTAGALEEEPSEVIVFQHAGGERAEWEDGKVQKEGTHPVVYPAAGSHATFYDSSVYLGNGQNGSGVGCDNTSEPLRELKLRPVLLPETAPEEGAFQWLSYRGRWGEREKGFNNGPTGPVTKTVWREPFAWMANQRSTSPRLPGGSVVGGPITGAFCGAVIAVTDLTHLATKSRPAAIGIVLAILLVLVLLFGVTRWGPIDLQQLRARRAFGQILRTARRLYRRHWWPLVPIGLIAFPIVGGVKALAEALANGRSVDEAAERAGVHLAFADLAETLGPPIAYTLVAAMVIVFVRELARGRQVGVRDSIRGMLAAVLAGGRRPADGHLRPAPAAADRGRDPDRRLEIRQLALRPAGGPLHRQVDPRGVPRQLRAGPRPLAAHGAGGRRTLAAQRRHRADPRLRADLHLLPAALDQPARLGRLRPLHPLRRRRPDAPLLRPPGARGRGTSEPRRLRLPWRRPERGPDRHIGDFEPRKDRLGL